MKRICIIGTGNVAAHLCVALSDKVDELINVSSRTLEEIPLDSDMYLLAVSDDAIAEVASGLPKLRGILAHTSGSVPMQRLEPYAERYGVFYPLQTFTKGDDLDYAEIPVFIEGNSPEVVKSLEEAAALFTTRIYPADSNRRRRLHIASVFACNYVNHLWDIADSLLAEDGLSLDVLHPLIKATAAKIRHMSPHEAQTGPARRGDLQVIEKHLSMLQDSPEADIYQLLADSILAEFHHPTITDKQS